MSNKTLYLLVGLMALSLVVSREAVAQNRMDSFRPVTQEMLTDPDPADWIMWRGGYKGWGYSPLDEINRETATDLRLAWSYSFAPGGPGSRGHQNEPLVHDGILYFRDAQEGYTAHDATTGDVMWSYQRELPGDLVTPEGEVLLDITLHVGRGMTIWEDKLISHSTDGTLFALDARTGELVWESKMTDHKRLQQPSGAPIVFNGVIVVPYNCTANNPDPCHMSGYHAGSGQMLWRWLTSPTQEDPLNISWGDYPQVYPPESRRNMSPWMTPAIDAETGLVIFGIGSSAPQQPALAGTSGEWPDRLYHGSTVALDHRTGRLMWWAQHHSDMWNNDSVFDRILVDVPVSPDPDGALGVNPDVEPGERRSLVIGSFSKDGIFYAYDRRDGTFIYARPTAYQNIIESYDGRTGAYTINPEVFVTGAPNQRVTVCRDSRLVSQGSYSPLTNAYYVPAWNGSCSITRLTSVTPTRETGYNTTTVGRVPNPNDNLGQPEAIDVTTGKTLWKLEREAPLYGMLTTGGGLLFAADTNRRFYALDQWTGEVIWQTILGGVSDMAPITYAVDGKQYLAVVAPGGTLATPGHVGALGNRAPVGVSNVGHTLYVFALPDR